MRCAITGSNGYVGSAIKNYFVDKGIDVIELKRAVTEKDNPSFVKQYSLSETTDFSFLDDVDILVHCAYDFTALRWDKIYKINVEGSLRIFQAASVRGIKSIFISTLSAFEGCVSLYGKAKLLIEKFALPLGITVIRPGLVYDTQPKGVVGALQKLADISPVFPLVNGGKQMLYFCHADDLAAMVYKCSINEIPFTNYLVAASERGMTFKSFLEHVAVSKNKKIYFVPVPFFLPLAILKSIEYTGIKMRIRSDSLISFINLNSSIDFSYTKKNGLTFRDYS